MLDRVTITGADDAVDIEALAALASEFRFAEWGILLSQSRMGQSRYPTFEWIQALLEAKRKRLPGSHTCFNLSGHICGKWVRDIENEGIFSVWDTLKNWDHYRLWNRFQINWGSRGSKVNLDHMYSAYNRSDWTTNPFHKEPIQFIIQCPNGDCSSLDAIRRHLADLNFNAVPLFDSSGGRGVVRSDWPQPWTPYSGYAGGLNPENLEEEYNKIAKCAGLARIWIDVESGVRDEDDRFDFDKVRSFLTQASQWIGK